MAKTPDLAAMSDDELAAYSEDLAEQKRSISAMQNAARYVREVRKALTLAKLSEEARRIVHIDVGGSVASTGGAANEKVN